MPGSRLASTEHSPVAPVLGFQGCRGMAGLGCQAATTLLSVWQGLGSSMGQRMASTVAEGRADSSGRDFLLALPRGLVLKQPCPDTDLTCFLWGHSQALALSLLLCKHGYGLVTRSGEGPESWQTFYQSQGPESCNMHRTRLVPESRVG